MSDIFSSCAANDYHAISYFVQQCGNLVDEVDDLGRTCLHIAASLGHFETVEVLLELNADLTVKDKESGWTPLHRAIYFGHVKVSLLLINTARERAGENEKSSIQTVRDRDGLSAMDLLLIKVKSNNSPILRHRSGSNTAPTIEFQDGCGLFAFGKSDVTLGIPLIKSVDIVRPRRVEALTEICVESTCAGKYHCLATSSTGQVYSWGHGRGGKLGHGTEDGMYPEPTVIRALLSQRIIRVALSDHHSMALTAEGILFSWGSNRFGQLGHADLDTTKHVNTPRRVEYFKRDAVLGIAAGECHCLCFTESGELYSWGSNKHGQLGLKQGEVGITPSGLCNLVPKKVSLPVKTNSSGILATRNENVAFISDVIASNQSSLVLLKVRNSLILSQNVFFHKYQRKLPHGFVSEVYQWGDGDSQPRKVHFHARSVMKRSRSIDETAEFNSKKTSKAAFSIDSPDAERIMQHFSDYYFAEHSQIIQVCAGKNQFAALSVNGVVFTWGLNIDMSGSDPYSAEITYSTPQIVDEFLSDRMQSTVSFIAASGRRIAAVTRIGEVYIWNAPLKRGNSPIDAAQIHNSVPKKMPGITSVKGLSLAEDYTMILVNLYLPSQLQGSPPSDRILAVDKAELDDVSDDEEQVDPLPATDSANLMTGEDLVGETTGSERDQKSLQELCQLTACQGVTFKNVFQALSFADTYHSCILQGCCLEFISRNLSSLLSYMKLTDLDRAIQEWKAPVQGMKITTGAHAASKPAPCNATPVKAISPSSLMKSSIPKDLSSSCEKLKNDVSGDTTNYSDPDVIARAMKSKHLELESVPNSSELQKLMRSTKKRLAAIQDLQDRVQREGYQLSSEQLQKVNRKLLLQAEHSLMEQFLVRLTNRERNTASKPAGSNPVVEEKAAKVEDKAVKVGEKTVKGEEKTEKVEESIKKPPAAPLSTSSSTTPKAKKAEWKKFDPFSEEKPGRPKESTATSKVFTTPLSSSTAKNHTMTPGFPFMSTSSPNSNAPLITTPVKKTWNISKPSTSPSVPVDASVLMPALSAEQSPMMAPAKSKPDVTPGKGSSGASASNGSASKAVPVEPPSVSFGTAFDFEKALSSKRQQKKGVAPPPPIPGADMPRQDISPSSAAKPAWGVSSFPLVVAAAAAAAAPSPSHPDASSSAMMASKAAAAAPKQSMVDILAEEEAVRIQQRYHPSHVPAIHGHLPQSGSQLPKQDNPWYVAQRTLALPLHQVIAQQSEEQEIATQMRRFEKLEAAAQQQKQKPPNKAPSSQQQQHQQQHQQQQHHHNSNKSGKRNNR